MKRSKLSHKLAAAATTAAVMGSTAAHATTGSTVTLSTMVSNVSTSASAIPYFLGLLGYIGGAGFAFAGILKLKQHVDNPGQTPMKDGLGRLAAGGLLFCLPLLTAAMQGSIGNGGQYDAETSKMIITGTSGFDAAGGP